MCLGYFLNEIAAHHHSLQDCFWCVCYSDAACIISLLYEYCRHLTLNMLNCFKDYKRCIHILNHILDLARLKLMKLSLEQQYMLSFLHSQYHACWCTGNFRSQCISRHGVDLQNWNIPSPTSEDVYLLVFLSSSLFENIVINLLPWNPHVSCLYPHLKQLAVVFRALQLFVLAVLGASINYFPCVLIQCASLLQ